ncbi:MAG: TIGR00299 family protein [Methanosphaera sp. rholeuAM130]|nr:MAG: TIGR00299 family protein [Methanosphaera sp. rholeuAM130]
MVLIIDAQTSGIAGNMFIGAFIDLGADKDKIIKVVEDYASEFGDISISIEKKPKNGIMSTYFNIQTSDREHRHYHELIDKIDEITKRKYPEDKTVKNSILLAKRIFKTIAVAESKVHGIKLNELHFHEVGCADAVADVIGASYAYYLLNLDKQKVYSLPVAVGSGTVKTSHGVLPVPAPAVYNILEDVPTVGSLAKCEIATPTGSSILVNITEEYVDSIPLIHHKKIGYGAGTKDLEVLNALRIIKADTIGQKDSISILETNVDTLSGEVLGSLFDKMLDEGARDISISPTIMKKNRPGHIIKIIAKNNDVEHLCDVLMQETGSLGVRIIPEIHRSVARREIVTKKVNINSVEYEVNYKVGYIHDKLITCRPEYEDVKLISQQTDIPIKDLENYLKNKYRIDDLNE